MQKSHPKIFIYPLGMAIILSNYMIEVAMIGVSRLESHGGEAVT